MVSSQSTWGVSSEQSGDNMNRFVVALAFVGCAFGAPSILPAVGHAYTAGSAVVVHGPAVATSGAYAAGPAVAHGAPVASAPAVVGQTHHTYAAGAPVVENRVEYGVVGHQVVQTGEVSVVGGHQYAVAGVVTIPQPAVSSIAGPPVNTVETRPLPPPVIPHAAPYVAAIPPAPTNQGPAPADTVVQQKILAPVRTHTRITPQQTNIIPQLNVQNYNVDVPVHVPVHTEQTHVVPGVAHVPTVASYATNAVVGHAAIPAAHGVIGAAHGIVGAAHGVVGAAGVIAH